MPSWRWSCWWCPRARPRPATTRRRTGWRDRDSQRGPGKLAKTKFVATAGLAAGATHQWLYKPYKAGTFKSGAKGRTTALIKGALAGAFTYNRLKAALNDAKRDPPLSKATTALSGAVDNLKNLLAKIKNGSATDADVNQFTNVTNSITTAGAVNGAPVTDQIPSASQLTQMVNS